MLTITASVAPYTPTLTLAYGKVLYGVGAIWTGAIWTGVIWKGAMWTDAIWKSAIWKGLFVCWLLNVPATCECISGTICSDNLTCCHTEIKAADQTFHLTQSQYTDTGLTSPSTDPITPGAWQGSHWSANV